MVNDFDSLSILSSSIVILFSNDEEVVSCLDIPIKQLSHNHNSLIIIIIYNICIAPYNTII